MFDRKAQGIFYRMHVSLSIIELLQGLLILTTQEEKRVCPESRGGLYDIRNIGCPEIPPIYNTTCTAVKGCMKIALAKKWTFSLNDSRFDARRYKNC